MKWASVQDQVSVTLCTLNQFHAISEEFYMAVALEQEEALVAVITKVTLMEANFLEAMGQAETEDVVVEVVIAAIVESVVDLQEVERVEQEDIRLEFNITMKSVNGI